MMCLSNVGMRAPFYSMANILPHSPESKPRVLVFRKYSSYSRDVVFECRSADRLPVLSLLSTVTNFRGVKSFNYCTDNMTITSQHWE